MRGFSSQNPKTPKKTCTHCITSSSYKKEKHSAQPEHFSELSNRQSFCQEHPRYHPKSPSSPQRNTSKKTPQIQSLLCKNRKAPHSSSPIETRFFQSSRTRASREKVKTPKIEKAGNTRKYSQPYCLTNVRPSAALYPLGSPQK